jgi:2-(1,2-epoxy-1,2-dihydrophenyl)acetyl-CoA isomerase
VDLVSYEVDDRGIARLTMNRPQALNALNGEMIAALAQATGRAAADDKARVVIIAAAGEHFMAGGDLKWFREELARYSGGGAEQAAQVRAHFHATLEQVHATTLNIRHMPKPVIASVQGAAAGFGLSLLLACDFALVAEDAYFTLAYCHIGLSPDGGATWSLPRLVGLKQATEIALLGERFDATAAVQLGLVNRAVPPDELVAETTALALRLAKGPTRALARTKTLLNQSFSNTLEAHLEAEQNSFAECAAEPDFVEGLTAFAEKRKPRF